MRLINIQTKKLEEFFGDEIPPYAILSHTWEKDEVSFDDWQKLGTSDKENVKRMKGYQKIGHACHWTKCLQHLAPDLISLRSPLEYLWVDTACIDKRSSAELSEAINSMFNWYRNSAICLVYMSDVDVLYPQAGVPPETKKASKKFILHETTYAQLKRSRWFTRGWTLQELLAPRHLLYLSRSWEIIGSQRDLLPYLSKASKIPIDVLQHKKSLALIPAAQKMFWASERKTARPEDIAYCLIGIFKVNMPLLYGEGSRAFRRLQLEIVKELHDHSIFLWEGEGRPSALAQSPQAFARSCSVLLKSIPWVGKNPYYATNVGLFMTLPLIQTLDQNIFLAVLDCETPHARGPSLIQYCLIVSKSDDDDVFGTLGHLLVDISRLNVSRLDTMAALKRTVYLHLPMAGSIPKPSLDEVAVAEGNPFMLAFSWNAQKCMVMEGLFPEDEFHDNSDTEWEYRPPRSLRGIVRLGKTNHPSGLQLLLLMVLNVEVNEKVFFMISYRPCIGWKIESFGSTPPIKANREAIARDILANKLVREPRKEDHKESWDYSLRSQAPTWPGGLDELNRSNGGLLTLEIHRRSGFSKHGRAGSPVEAEVGFRLRQ